MVKPLTPQQAAEWLATGEAVIVDVREADEFKSGHIAYAVSLPAGQIQGAFAQLNLPRETKIIFQCLKGGRGEKAAQSVSEAGIYENEIYNLAGGITAWQAAGLPVIGKASGISIFRQVQMVVGCLIALLVMAGFAGFMAAFVIAGLLGAALFMAGLTGWCGLAILLGKMPWNQPR